MISLVGHCKSGDKLPSSKHKMQCIHQPYLCLFEYIYMRETYWNLMCIWLIIIICFRNCCLGRLLQGCHKVTIGENYHAKLKWRSECKFIHSQSARYLSLVEQLIRANWSACFTETHQRSRVSYRRRRSHVRFGVELFKYSFFFLVKIFWLRMNNWVAGLYSRILIVSCISRNMMIHISLLFSFRLFSFLFCQSAVMSSKFAGCCGCLICLPLLGFCYW